MNQPYPISAATTVVVIDDDPGFCRTLTDILETRDLHVFAFDNSSPALELIDERKPAVSLIDLRLPKVSGLKLLEQIKEASPDTECILLTGYASQESAIAAINLGAFSYLQKPYDLEQLILTIQQAAHKHQSAISLRQRTADLDLLNRLNHAANRGASVEDLISILSATVRQNFRVFATTLYLLNPEHTHLEMVHTSVNESYLNKLRQLLHIDIPAIRLPLDRLTVIPKLIDRREPSLIQESTQIERWIADFVETETLTPGLRPAIRKAIPQIVKLLDISEILSLPLYVEGDPIGLLDFVTQQPFSPTAIDRLTGFGEQLIAILQRKQAEEALARVSYQNELILNTMAEGILGLDVLGRHTFVNPTAARLLGYTAAELLGQPGHSLWHHSRGDGSVFVEEDSPIYQTLEQGTVHSVNDDTFWRQDGQPLPVEYTCAPLLANGEIIGAVLAFRDISERKRSEAQLQRLLQQVSAQSQQLSEVMDAVPEGVMFLDNDYYVVLANRVAKEDLDLLAGAGVGTKLEQLGSRILTELLTSPPAKGRWHEIHYDDRIFEVISRPISTGSQAQGWVLVLDDVTQDRSIQKQVQQQERLAAIGQLAAGIAHDFNNILAVIVLYAKLGLRPDDIPPTVADYLRTILDQTKRASNLIQQILDFSRRSVLERQAIDLNRFIASQVELLRRTLPENIDIRWTPLGRQAMAKIDLTRMQQAILNIAMNARDAMVDGGTLQITLVASTSSDIETCATCGQSLTGTWQVMEFSDTGEGIDAEIMRRLFEPFFTTKESGQGTGLGLAQVFGIMKQHEGHILVRSQKGHGATFTMLLPAIATAATVLPEAIDDVVVVGHGETVLVVEDDKLVLQALTLTLKDLNYRVLEAPHGRDALKMLKAHRSEIMLVISDMVMPVMGGKALFYAKRELKYDIPMIIITGHPMEAELEQLRQEGLDDWMLKPPDPQVLS
ncbi:MAG: response regulator, partial [Chloroflexi bacterium]|nr:response regulator [Chloroflexota bacterium]